MMKMGGYGDHNSGKGAYLYGGRRRSRSRRGGIITHGQNTLNYTLNGGRRRSRSRRGGIITHGQNTLNYTLNGGRRRTRSRR